MITQKQIIKNLRQFDRNLAQKRNVLKRNVSEKLHPSKDLGQSFDVPWLNNQSQLENKFGLRFKMVQEIIIMSKPIKDKHIRKYIVDSLVTLSKENDIYTINQKEALKKLRDLIDAYRSFKGDYSPIANSNDKKVDFRVYKDIYKTKYPTEIKYLTDQEGPLFNYLWSKFVPLRKDFKNEIKVDRMRDFFKNYPDDNMTNYLYEKYYIKQSFIPKAVQKGCLDILKKYNVKIILPQDLTDAKKVFRLTDREFSHWIEISEGAFKRPPILDFSKIKPAYIDETAAYGKSVASGFCNTKSGLVSVNGMATKKFMHTVRHELMHANDINVDKSVQEVEVRTSQGKRTYKISEIMPKIEKYNDRGNRYFQIDFAKCKFKEEFLNAGINKEHIEYAYNNPAEFIAVAAEGDISRYSPEFKQILVGMGFPKWALNLENFNYKVSKNIKNVEKVQNENLEKSLEELFF